MYGRIKFAALHVIYPLEFLINKLETDQQIHANLKMQSASTNKNSKAKCFNSSNQFPATEKHGQGKKLKTKYFKQIKYSKQR